MLVIEREQLKTRARILGSTRSFGKSVHLDKKKHGTGRFDDWTSV